jgi:hypothetical protein
MPDPNRLILTLKQAALHYRNTPRRRGRFIDLADAREVLVVGDLHGNLENFRQAMKIADLARHPTRHLVLQELLHGPFLYPNGGDRSHQLFDCVAALKCQFPRQVHLLPGNHELAQFTGRCVLKNDRDLNQLFVMGVESAYGAKAGDVLEAYREVFLTLPFALRTRNRVFLSHSAPAASRLAGFDPAILEQENPPESEFHPGGSLYALCWGRDTEEEHIEAFLGSVEADFLICGHIPCEQGYSTPNPRQLILDSISSPAAYCLFPTDRPLTFEELVSGVHLLPEG